ncbi:radical SAM protein [Nitrosospira briensis]|uniref:radical SAM protein n=1 Tax=Nitrosospira briensis TaxID=35799 RepID=UPI0008F18864|nr:radical SAM protein [Nitrosospira briensis]SFN75769.1 hypothetical protein SAMN05216332_101502 [Nitrosospira briensis]
MGYMTPEAIARYSPDRLPSSNAKAMDRVTRTLARLNLAGPNQQSGQRWTIGCVALEITQRCNLDCTLCYLSENSEAVQDIPIEEIFRRIDLIRAHFGSNTDVQITGGEPTLRKHDELLAIVRKVRSLGLRPTLMTNGLRATRSLLRQLASAGLMDVAFHVDTTQQIKGFRTEIELNVLRRKFIDRAGGLGLSIMFNTTVHDNNFDEIPDVVRFFAANAASVRTASFQLQADTGRGVQRERGARITQETLARQIELGAGTSIRFDASLVGHPSCSRYGMCLEANGSLYDAFDDSDLIARVQAATADIKLDRANPSASVKAFARWLAFNPTQWWPLLHRVARKAWQMKGDLLRAHGHVHTLSFVMHNFMDSKRLDEDRVSACVFKVMTSEGPLSMCMHNAKRDNYIFQPIRLYRRETDQFWDPVLARTTHEPLEVAIGSLPTLATKRLKGRSRIKALRLRKTDG